MFDVGNTFFDFLKVDKRNEGEEGQKVWGRDFEIQRKLKVCI